MPDDKSNENWTDFGWQGFRTEVPAEWNPSHLEGDYKGGTIRLSDSRSIRLTLQWDSGAKPGAVHRSVHRYLKEVEREVRKSGESVSVKRDTNLVSWRERTFECYACRGRIDVNGVVWQCPECRRMVHAAVFSSPGQKNTAEARRVIQGMTDHPDGAWQFWCFYGHRFELPERFRLQRSVLRTGCLEMVFTRRSSIIEIVRMSLAEDILAGDALQDWFRSFYGTRLEDYRHEVVPTEYREHRALDCEGALTWYKRGSVFFRNYRIRVRAWHCPEEDKLYVFRWSGLEVPEAEFRQSVDRLACHLQE